MVGSADSFQPATGSRSRISVTSSSGAPASRQAPRAMSPAIPAKQWNQATVAVIPLPGARPPRMRAAAQAAPKPLSMPTTATPGAQLASMASRAVMPSKDEPYPALVGTATTGDPTSPPTAEASAPSMPATTMTTSAARRRSSSASRRWMPATPTSLQRAGGQPRAPRVAAASSATGRSAVPAQAMSAVPVGAGAAGRHTTRRATSWYVPPGTVACTWAASSGVARVSRTGPVVGPSRSSVTIARQCSGVFPGPYTASGNPCRS